VSAEEIADAALVELDPLQSPSPVPIGPVRGLLRISYLWLASGSGGWGDACKQVRTRCPAATL